MSLFSDSSEEEFSVFGTASDDNLRATVSGRNIVMALDRQTFLNIEEKFSEVRAAEGRREDNLSNEGDPAADQSSTGN